MNVDSLRVKRVRRLGIKATTYNGQRKIFNIFERATRKFHGDVGLWLQYAEYARAQKANKKLARIFTDMLRMHPTRPELWIYAARYSIDIQADFGAARTYMQRGLRFNKTSKAMYLEYAKMEMIYIAKIAARRRILGLDESKRPVKGYEHVQEDTGIISLTGEALQDEKLDPLDAGLIDDDQLRSLSTTPALAGAIPLAVFDAAMKQFPRDDMLAEQFFTSFANFVLVPSLPTILDHVLNGVPSIDRNISPRMQSCFCRLPLIGIAADSAEYPAGLRTSLKRIKDASAGSSDRAVFLESLRTWLEPLSGEERLPAELQTVVLSTLKRYGT